MLGSIFNLNYGGSCEIVHYENAEKVWVLFDCGYLNNRTVRMSELRKGEVKNPYFPTIFGLGYLGFGKYNTKDIGGNGAVYRLWKSMLNRCYNELRLNTEKSYRGCTVCDEWLNFQNFAKWYLENDFYGLGYDLDKDMLSISSKVYSPETCCLIPKKINNLVRETSYKNSDLPRGVQWSSDGIRFLGRFSQGGKQNTKLFDNIADAESFYYEKRREYAKKLAELFKGKIDNRVYKKLYNI